VSAVGVEGVGAAVAADMAAIALYLAALTAVVPLGQAASPPAVVDADASGGHMAVARATPPPVGAPASRPPPPVPLGVAKAALAAAAAYAAGVSAVNQLVAATQLLRVLPKGGLRAIEAEDTGLMGARKGSSVERV